MIPTAYIDDLLARVDIVDIVGRHVELTRKGKNHFGVCPFHKEPQGETLSVSPEKQFFHCFACGAHGSSIRFLMQHCGLEFVDAVHTLSAEVGIPPPPGVRARPRASSFLELAKEHYRKSLKDASAAIQFLKGVGISGKTAAKFRLGYASEGWQNLEPVLGGAYRGGDVLHDGLVIENASGRRYDRFRDRLIFPVTNFRGDVISLVGRAVGNADPTWLSSPTKDVLGGEQNFFGLSQARASMHERDEVYVAPGCVGALILAECGFDNSISVIRGRSLKDEHFSMLFRHVGTITLCFNGSDQGRRKSWSAARVAAKVISDKKGVRFALFPGDGAGDSLIQNAEDAVELGLILRSSIDLSDFLVQELTARFPPSSTEGRAAALAEIDNVFEGNKNATRFKELLVARMEKLWAGETELIDSTEKHDDFLMSSIKGATSEVIIVSPWVSRQGVTRTALSGAIGAATARGVKVIVYTDIDFNRDRKKTKAGDLFTDGAYGHLTSAGATVLFVKKLHSKIIFVDDAAMCAGSFNWLSAARSGRYHRHEVSIINRNKDQVSAEKAKVVADLSSRAEVYDLDHAPVESADTVAGQPTFTTESRTGDARSTSLA